MMDKSKFYASLRTRNSGVFGTSLSQSQVDTMNAILEAMRGDPVGFIAYTMATAYHEPGPRSRMKPNRENLHYTTAGRIRKVWPTRFKSDAAAQPYTRNAQKLANKVYNGRLGNRDGTDDGYIYRGGGLDHLTGRSHYITESKRQGVDLVGRPELIATPAVAVRSLVHGMKSGRYRGKKLADYMRRGGFDYYNARDIVNADKRLYGATIAKYAAAFEAALVAAGYDEDAPAGAPVEILPDPDTPVAPSQEIPAPSGFIAAILAAISAFISWKR